MSSGVAVDDSCLSAFQDLKLKKKYRYIIYKLSDDNKIIQVEKTAEKGTYDEFLSQLPAEDCRYAIFDVEYEVSASEGTRNKICFYVWAPDASRVKQKMLYASSKDALRKKLVGVACEIQGTDYSEVDFNTVLERIRAI